jgi:dienelactone hydrolase
MKKLFVFFLFFYLTGCVGISPQKMKEYTYVEYPEKKADKYPVVFFFQGSGGSNNNAYNWCQWFEKKGFACVFINSSGVRGVRNLQKYSYYCDLNTVLDVVKNDKKLDLNNYIVMGFSKGGTEAMKSGACISKDNPKPKLVLALYPGGFEGCPVNYTDTKVYIFYGDKDEWGSYRGIRQSCIDTADTYSNVDIFILKNAQHGYDGDWAGGFQCCGGYFRVAPNPKALKKTKTIIEKLIHKYIKVGNDKR